MRKRNRIWSEKEQPVSVSVWEPEGKLWSQYSDRASLRAVYPSLSTSPVHVCMRKSGCAVWPKKVYLDLFQTCTSHKPVTVHEYFKNTSYPLNLGLSVPQTVN